MTRRKLGSATGDAMAQALGYPVFIGLMAAGYYYNVTFVQLGLLDLGTRVVGLDELRVAGYMAGLALGTSLVALAVGWAMTRRGWSENFLLKLRAASGVALVQTMLTAVAPSVQAEWQFAAWIASASLALGVGVPVMFGLTVDFVPRAHRGLVAAAITALAYLGANTIPTDWTIDALRAQLVWFLPLGAIGLGLLAFVPLPWTRVWAQQHEKPEFARGRFVRTDEQGHARMNRRLIGFIGAMFAVFFIDSLGFLRIIDTPGYVASAWQSVELGPRLFIGLVHVGAALIAGVLYAAFRTRTLLLWIFGLFALVHLMYTFPVRWQADVSSSLAEPMIYAIAVSFYTVLNFALWVDLSTPKTIARNAAFGVALSGWTATFLSTGLAMQWRTSGMGLEQHLRIVDALAVVFFLIMLALALWPRQRTAQRGSARDLS